MQCLDEGAVLALVAGELVGDARERSEAHLDGCSQCLALVAEVARGALGAAAGPADSSRYQIGEEIARGGMGTVHAARDRVLERDVAVKLMRAGAPTGSPMLVSGGLARRFAREVTLTARLQHPAIVPIYDAGVLADGTPFYAMRMVAGQSLDRAAAGDRSARLALVPSVLAAAEAIAYAHSEGVVHRDLKPQNVLVGKFGETVVLDWGLAKDLRRDPPDEPLPPAALASGSGETTRAGEVVGTPGYMPPERLDGDPGDERGDVYGLGAILYHVLAGELPRRRAGEEPEPLGRRAPGVPRELEAIAARAMARDPARRYASAGELADDLRRFQTGRLVSAHRYSRRELVRRWIGRHRAAVAAALLALAGVAAVTAISFRRVVAERGEAQAQERRAEAERRAAEQLVGFILGDLRVELEKIGRLDALAGAGRSIDAYFARVPVRAGGGGADDLFRRGQALSLLGDAALAAGDLDGAAGHYDRALEALRGAAARAPGERADDALCRTYLRQGDVARARGELDRANQEARRCQAVADRHQGAPWMFHRTSALTDQGKNERIRGDGAAARRHLDRAAAELARLEAAVAAGAALPAESPLAMLRAVVKDNQVVLGLETGDLALARRAGEENRAALEALRAAHPDDPDTERQLAVARTQLGAVYLTGGDPAAARGEFEAARAAMKQLVARDPSNAGWKRDLGIALSRLAEVELARGEGRAALAYQEQSRDITRALAALQPDSRDIRRDLVADELTVAQIQHELGDLEPAAATVRRAAAAAEALAKGDPHARDDLSIVLAHQAAIDIARKKPALAAPAAVRSLELRRAALAADPTPAHRRAVAEILLVTLDLPAAARPLPPCAALGEARTALAPVADNPGGDADVASVLADLARAEKKHAAACRHD